jgi:hypothetical protein
MPKTGDKNFRVISNNEEFYHFYSLAQSQW